jgi:hypothetical protein
VTGHHHPRAAGSTAEGRGARRHGRQQAGAYSTAGYPMSDLSHEVYTPVAGKRVSTRDELTMLKLSMG